MCVCLVQGNISVIFRLTPPARAQMPFIFILRQSELCGALHCTSLAGAGNKLMRERRECESGDMAWNVWPREC